MSAQDKRPQKHLQTAPLRTVDSGHAGGQTPGMAWKDVPVGERYRSAQAKTTMPSHHHGWPPSEPAIERSSRARGWPAR
jgi:hypothetical protein